MSHNFNFDGLEKILDKAARQIWLARISKRGSLQAALLPETLDALDKEISIFFRWLQASDDAQNLQNADRSHLWMKGKICESHEAAEWRKQQSGISLFRYAGKEQQGDPGVLVPVIKGLLDFCNFHIVHSSKDGAPIPGKKSPSGLGKWTVLRDDFDRWHKLVRGRAMNVRAALNELADMLRLAGVDPRRVPENVQWSLIRKAGRSLDSDAGKDSLEDLVLFVSFCMLGEAEFRNQHGSGVLNSVLDQVALFTSAQAGILDDRFLSRLIDEGLVMEDVFQMLLK